MKKQMEEMEMETKKQMEEMQKKMRAHLLSQRPTCGPPDCGRESPALHTLGIFYTPHIQQCRLYYIYSNAMDLEQLASFKWGDVEAFGRSADALAASGEPVTLLLFDFEGYFPQFPRANTEHWWHEEFVSSQGSSVATRGNFGMADLPNATSRFNFAVLEMIRNKLRVEQAMFPDLLHVTPYAAPPCRRRRGLVRCRNLRYMAVYVFKILRPSC
eukprot:SAG22_NODE_261_length_13373_cov_17.745472_13_plen_214_part_00